MNIHPISLGELDAFAACGHDPERAASVRSYLDQLLTQGSTRPEWLFVAEDSDQLLGTVGLWAIAGQSTPMDFILLEAPWENGALSVGDALLDYTLGQMRSLGSKTVGHVLDMQPIWPQWQTHAEQRAALLERFGFGLVRETLRFDWHASQPLPAASTRLRFRSLVEVGEDAFLDAIVRVSQGILDRSIEADRQKMGPEAEARDLFTLVQHLGYEPESWQLAYASDDSLVGLSMPNKGPTAGSIGYIGVTPEQRGHGYIDDLLAQITRTLIQAGVERIIADTDTGNFPMAAAFRRGGYREFGRRREYSRPL